MSKTPPAKPTVESIMKECELEVKRGLGAKSLGKEARYFWVTTYTNSITERLQQKDADWTKDRIRILPVSRKLGKVAAALTSGKVVPLWAAEAAAVAIKADPKCPSGPRRGGYCDIVPL